MKKYLSPAQIFIKNSDNLTIYKHFFSALVDLDLTELHAEYAYAHINKKKDSLYLSFKAVSPRMEEYLRSNINFTFSVEIKEVVYFIFKFPDLLLFEVNKIIEGKLLTLSKSTKEKICRLSGLPHNVKEGAFISSHVFLQALYADSPIRRLIAEYISVEVEMLNPEVLSEIEEDSLIYIENFIKQ